MTQLENNTTALEAILATVNALPNAGSGGGEVSGYQVATGTFTVSTAVTAANATAATVSGLAFKPSIVSIIRNGSKTVSNSTTNKNKYSLMALIKQENELVKHLHMGMGSSTTSVSASVNNAGGNILYEVEMTNDGFILKRAEYTSTSQTYQIDATSYYYIAIG